MFDPRRLRGALAALLVVMLAVIAGGLPLSPVVAGHPRWLPDSDSLCDVVGFKSNLNRIGGVLRELRERGESPGGQRLGILIGSSSLEWGVDPALMPAMGGSRPMRWLSLSGVGASIEDNARMADLALRAGLRPELTLICIGPAPMSTRINVLDDPISPDLAALREHVAAHHPMLAKEDLESFLLVPLNRLLPNRSRIGRWSRLVLFDARLALFAALGYNLDSLGPPMDDPWSATPGWAKGDHMPDWINDNQFAGLSKAHIFEAESYSADSANCRHLVEYVRMLRGAGSEVVILLVPEAERRRIVTPPEFLATLREALRRAFGPDAPPVLDFRDAMPPSALLDLSHLNPGGRAAFTERLGRALLDLHRPRAGLAAP